MITTQELKIFYDALDSNFEGYIQMSNEPLQIVENKPSWDEIHKEKNFIYEAALFDGDRSIMIRQINDGFILIDEKLSHFTNTTQETFFATDGKKVKLTQVWEEIEDTNCEGMKVQTPTLQLFTGFEKGDIS